jgi:hypothetical protein
MAAIVRTNTKILSYLLTAQPRLLPCDCYPHQWTIEAVSSKPLLSGLVVVRCQSYGRVIHGVPALNASNFEFPRTYVGGRSS